MSRSVVFVIGTRPEAIKMAPLILRLKQAPSARVTVLATGQHRELFKTAIDLFGIAADHDLNLMTPDQSLAELTARLMVGLDAFFREHKPDLVLVQGDTTSAMAAGLASFYLGIPVGHVEAGLRTGNLQNPFPEELNRTMLSRFATWHFCPTELNKRALLAEGISRGVHVTGNTIIDALKMVAARDYPAELGLNPNKRLILATVHRRESFGEPLRRITAAFREIADRFADVEILIPVHPNPSVQNVIRKELLSRPNILLCEPLEYGPFVTLLKRCYFAISDSGGVQEEAPALGKPVLVIRDETERLEAIDAGVAKLVGTDTRRIVDTAEQLLLHEPEYRAMARGCSPYGDGMAAGRIANILGF